MNIENLTILADYLDSLPEDYEHFDMRNFYTHNDENVLISRVNRICSPCGTAACVVGLGPAAGLKILPEDYSWVSYSNRVFDISFWDNENNKYVKENSHMWNWLFSGDWAKFDNSIKGAVARLRYTIRTGAYPKEFPENPTAAMAAIQGEVA